MKILVIGSANIDITVKVDRFPEKGETIIGKPKNGLPCPLSRKAAQG